MAFLGGASASSAPLAPPLLDVGVEGKGGVKDDTQVADFRRWGRSHQPSGAAPWVPQPWFPAVEFEEIGRHPGFYVVQAVDKKLRGELGGWSSAEIYLGIISIAVEVESMMADVMLC